MKAREAACRALARIMNEGAYANICVNSMLKAAQIDERDRNLFTELVYGTVKASGTLDWMIGCYARNTGKIEPMTRNILRLGFYQLFFMERIPASAACNEAVELAKKHINPGAAKYINAIMRTALREPGKMKLPDVVSHPAEYLSLKYWHPLWLVKRWLVQYGAADTGKLCLADNMAPDLAVRVNTAKVTVEAEMEELRAAGCVVRRSQWLDEALLISEHPPLAQIQLLADGSVFVQDESSQLACAVLAPQPGDFVLDCCAAPGGKSVNMALRMNNQGRVLSCDIHEHKLQLISAGAKSAAVDIIAPELRDARSVGEIYCGQADRVLADVPCSGLGVLRRKADIRWKKSCDGIAELPGLQLQILESAAKALKPGGELLYSTCTTETAENEGVINAFLERHRGYSLLHAGSRMPCKQKDCRMINMLPFVDGTDGFFIALLRREV